MKRTGAPGCACALFLGTCGVVFAAIVMWLAGLVAVILGLALAVIVLRQVAVGIRYAIKYSKSTRGDQ